MGLSGAFSSSSSRKNSSLVGIVFLLFFFRLSEAHKDVVKALKAVNVSVVAIIDFDILNSRQNMRSLVDAFGIDWDNQLENEMKVIYDSMHAQGSNGTNPWVTIKKIEKA